MVNDAIVNGPATECRLSFMKGETSHCMIRSPYRPYDLLCDDSKLSLTSPCSRSLLESRVALRVKHPYKKRAWEKSYKLWDKHIIGWLEYNIANQERKVCYLETFYSSKDKKLTWFWFAPTPVASIIIFEFCVSIFAFASAHQHRRACYLYWK